MDVKIDFICSYWDDWKGLFRLLESIPVEVVNNFFIRDGRYIPRTDPPEYSQDATNFVISEIRRSDPDWPGKIEYHHNGNKETQIEKRNALWSRVAVDDADFCIVIDSDEYFSIEIDKLNESFKAIKDKYPYRCFPIVASYYGSTGRLPRGFKAPFNFRHKLNPKTISHGSLYDEDGIEIIHEMYKYDEFFPLKRGVPAHQNAPEGIRIFANKGFMSDTRLKNNEIYYTLDPHR